MNLATIVSTTLQPRPWFNLKFLVPWTSSENAPPTKDSIPNRRRRSCVVLQRSTSGMLKTVAKYALTLSFILTSTAVSAHGYSTLSASIVNWSEAADQSTKLAELTTTIQNAITNGHGDHSASDFTYTLNARAAERFNIDFSDPTAIPDITFKDGQEFDFERDGSSFTIVLNSTTTVTTLRPNSLTITIAITNVEERPTVLAPYNAGDNEPGRTFYRHFSGTSNPGAITIQANSVFKDPEGQFIQLKQCADDFAVTESDLDGSNSATRGDREVDTLITAQGRERHCPQTTSTGYDATLDVARGGTVVNLNTFGPTIQITPVRGTLAGIRKAVIKFNGWAGAGTAVVPVLTDNASEFGDAETANLVSEAATITVFVKTGANNAPSFAGGASGFGATKPETIGDSQVLIGPPQTGAWNAIDLDTQDTISYSLQGPPASATCSEEETAVTLGTAGCAWLVVDENNNVSIYGKGIDFESTPGGQYTLNLVASDGFGGQTSIPIILTVTNVDEPIEAPTELNQIRQLVVGRGSRTVDLNTIFKDPDGTPITYDVLSTNPATVTATISGSILTVSPAGGVGPAQISITAKSTGVQSILTRVYSVSVRQSNLPPRFVTSALTVLAGPIRENAPIGSEIAVPGARFNDPEGDMVTARVTEPGLFEAVADKSNPQTGMISLRLLGALDYETAQEHRVSLILNDGWDDSVTTVEVQVRVTDINEPPQLATDAAGNPLTIPDLNVAVGATKSLDASEYFMDPEGARLVITAQASTGNTNVNLKVVGASLIQYTGVSSTQGTPVVVTLTATDTENSISTTFRIYVASNRNPELARVITVQPIQASKDRTIDLSGLFIDPDPGDAVTGYQASSSNDGVVIARVSSDGVTLVLIARAPGDAIITITATDQRGGSNTTTIPVTVIRNEPPTRRPGVFLGSIDVDRVENKVINLNDYFVDPEGDTLTFSAVSSRQTFATVDIVGNTMTIKGLQVGDSQGTLTIRDGFNDPVREFFSIRIVNIGPEVVGDIPELTTYRNESNVVDLSQYFNDPDNDTLTYKVVPRKDNVVRTQVLSNGQLNVTGRAVDSTVIDVVAEDAHRGQVTTSFLVFVSNYEPVVEREVPSQMLVRGEETSIPLRGLFSDKENDPLEYRVSVEDGKVAQAAVVGNAIELTGIAVGETVATLTANDGYIDVSSTFAVVVNNIAPSVVMQIADATTHRKKSIMLDLSSSFADDDGDDLTYSVDVTSTAIATASIDSNDQLTVTGVALGNTVITVTATDEYDESAMATFVVTVENIAPKVMMEIEDQATFRTGDVSVDLSTIFEDEDGDPLTFSAQSGNSRVAGTGVSGSMLTVTGLSVGQAQITVSAMDAYDGSASTTFMIEIENRSPVAVGSIDAQTTNRNIDVTVNLMPFFSDPDNDPLTYTAVSAQAATASVSVNGAVLTISGVEVGDTTVTVTAADEFDATAMQEIAVSVENLAPMATREIADITTDRTKTETVDLTGLFSDADNDTLTLMVDVADTSIATASLDMANLELTIDPENLGTTAMTVTATDQYSDMASVSFDVTVQNLQPALGETIAAIMLQVGGEAATVDVTNGFTDDAEGLTYAVTIGSEAVATASIDGSMVSVTPMGRGQTAITVTATDPQGLSNMQQVAVTVSDSELKAVANLALAGFGRAVLSSVSSSVGSRLLADADGLYTPLNTIKVAELNADGSQPVAVRSNLHQDTLLESDPWATGINPSRDVAQSYSTDAIRAFLEQGVALQFGAIGDPNFFSVWGAVDRQSYEAGADGYEGDATSFYFGADYTMRGSFLVGLAVGRNTGESSYTFGTATQTMDASLTTILPYARYSPSDRTTVYGTIGFGSGELETSVIGADFDQADLSASIGLLGGRQYVLGTNAGLDLAIVADFGFANLETDDGPGGAAGLAADTSRIRGGVEGSLNMAMGADGSFVPFLNLNLRSDSGDGNPDSGLEVAGGIRMINPIFSIDLNFRTLATYGADDYSESGFSAMALLNPTAGATGFSFSVAPRWGADTQASNIIWQDDIQVSDIGKYSFFGNSKANRSLESKVGYGFLVQNEQFILTPFLDLTSDDMGYRQVSLGAKLTQAILRDQKFDVNLIVGQRSREKAENEETVQLRTRLSF